MMASGYELCDLHAQQVQVELNLGGRCVTVTGIAEYKCGALHVAIQDPAGDFTLILNDALWNDRITDAPDGNGFLIQLHDATQD